jgi:hypothetical protein
MEKYTNEQLKAIAYDNIVAIERSQLELKLINEELAKRSQQVEEVKKEKKKD